MFNPKTTFWSKAIHEISPKSEKLEKELIMKSYVDMGHLDRISNSTSQYIYGRRGTGKTHLFKYISEHINTQFEEQRKLAIYIDTRSLHLESDEHNLSPKYVAKSIYRELIREIATSLEDVMQKIFWQNAIPTQRNKYDQLISQQSRDAIHKLYQLVNQGVVRPKGLGKITQKQELQKKTSVELKASASLDFAKLAPSGDTSASAQSRNDRIETDIEERELTFHLSFQSICETIEEFCDINEVASIFIFIDEWSDISKNVQPHFAECIKRTFFSSDYICVKIATLPFQTNFSTLENGKPIGFERNGDIYLGLDLDEDLVFVKDKERVIRIFSEVLNNHLKYVLERVAPGEAHILPDDSDIIRETFFNPVAYDRMLAFSQGNVRDYLTLFQRAYGIYYSHASKKIDVPTIEKAAKEHGIEKIESIKEDRLGYTLFNSIIREVLQKKRVGSFLVENSFSDNRSLLYLIHNRTLHVWDKSYSAPSYAGKRFLLIAIDFCIILEHTKAPSYRHIFQNLNLPLNDVIISDSSHRQAALFFQDEENDLLVLEQPDKRSARFTVLSNRYLVSCRTCLKCHSDYDVDHPVVRKHKICPRCGESLGDTEGSFSLTTPK